MGARGHSFLFLLSGILLLTLLGCTAHPGEKCGGFLDGTCSTGKCVNSTCLSSVIGEACSARGDCVQGNCVVGICRAPSNIGELCELPSDCVKGVCKNSVCVLGSQDDSCAKPEDCGPDLTCVNNQCKSNGLICQLVRLTGITPGAAIVIGILAIAIAILGAIYGLPNLGGVTVTVSGVVIDIGLLAFGIITFCVGLGLFSCV